MVTRFIFFVKITRGTCLSKLVFLDRVSCANCAQICLAVCPFFYCRAYCVPLSFHLCDVRLSSCTCKMRASLLTVVLLATYAASCYAPDPKTIFENIKIAEHKLQTILIENSDIRRALEDKREESTAFRNSVVALSAHVSTKS